MNIFLSNRLNLNFLKWYSFGGGITIGEPHPVNDVLSLKSNVMVLSLLLTTGFINNK